MLPAGASSGQYNGKNPQHRYAEAPSMNPLLDSGTRLRVRAYRAGAFVGQDGCMSDVPRWFSETKEGHSQWYIERFRQMARDGVDLAGEARFVDALSAPRSRILDAGCGPGRVGGELHARGHEVVGVDVDPQLIEAAKTDHPGPTWLVGDLSQLDLAEAGERDRFDTIVVAGNVMAFVAPGTEAKVLRSLQRHLKDVGRIALGFGLDRGYSLEAFDADILSAGLQIEQRFSTWDIRPFGADSDFTVTVLVSAH